jgi:hypothetical protein
MQTVTGGGSGWPPFFPNEGASYISVSGRGPCGPRYGCERGEAPRHVFSFAQTAISHHS